MTTNETARRLAEAMGLNIDEHNTGNAEDCVWIREKHENETPFWWSFQPKASIADALHAAEVICEPKGWDFEIAYRTYPRLKTAEYECAIEKYEGNDHICRIGLYLPSTLCTALNAALDEEE